MPARTFIAPIRFAVFNRCAIVFAATVSPTVAAVPWSPAISSRAYNVARAMGDAMYSLGQAAKATGRSKSALSRDIKAGKISATRNTDGSLSIDPAELHRVHPAVS